MKLTAELIEGFAGTFLSPMYDNAKPTPQFHREAWALYASDEPFCAVAAPRGHAKSTALTHDYTLAVALFRVEDYMILVSSNEEMAIEHLGDITRELLDNEDIIRHFNIAKLETQAKTDIIVNFRDGHQCRIIARGSGQKMRGRKWKGKRPGLIICDDLEDDEQVENVDRRVKFRRWFNRALLPAMRRGGKARLHGTIMHEDSLLARLMKAESWKTLLYRAHKGFDDFSEILWPEQFTEKELKRIRKTFVDDFDAPGYSQEYLNEPFDNSEAYLKAEDFIAMDALDHSLDKKICVGVDFAVSKKDKANRSSFTVGGQDAGNRIHFVGEYVGRWDSLGIMDEMFKIQEKHDPHFFFVEDGVIWKSLEPMVNQEMSRRNVFLSIIAIPSVKDKATRGRSFQRRMRAQACRFDKEAEWYAGFELELRRFTGTTDATLDDQFDSAAILIRGYDDLPVIDDEYFMTDEEIYFKRQGPPRDTGRNATTGY
jgi:predicted phage terminase large subunit-like protein